MLFQLMDSKSDCKGYFAEGKLFFENEFPDVLRSTWKYSLHMAGRKNIEYANLYCRGKSLEEVCPPHLEHRLDLHTTKLKAFLRSFVESKVCLSENCFYDLVPHKFLVNYYDVKNDITKHVLENYEKPVDYRHLRDLSKVVETIREQDLNIDLTAIRDLAHTQQTKNFINKIQQIRPVCDYDIFGSKTGRLTTKSGTFPILTMDKKYRSILKPHNDWFVELDFNAAELRTILTMSGMEQPAIDIHEWNAQNIWKGKKTREEAKKSIFAWLYNPNSPDVAPNKYYDREYLLTKYYDSEEGTVTTPFGREIEADPHHAINYLVQSTTAEMTLKQIVRISKLLENSKSFIAFTMHDSVVIDMSHDERDLLMVLLYSFASTDLGEYLVNITAGQDFGAMRDLSV